MVTSEIDRIKNRLVEGATHCYLDVDDNDRWNIRFENEKHRSVDACEIAPILSLEFSGALCEERPQVVLVMLRDASATLVLFDNSLSDGYCHVMGIAEGLVNTPEFVKDCLTRWTATEQFVWPETVKINSPSLVRRAVMMQLLHGKE